MTLSVKQTQQKKMAEVRAALARPQYVHLSCRILVHEPAPAGSKPCACCGSVFARIAEEHDDGEILIDRHTGRRILPRQLKPETWAKAVAVAEHHDIVYRVSRDQYPLLIDDTDRHILLSGTNRAGKTQLALLWIVRQWIKRGGRRLRFWFCAKERGSALALLGKIFEGDDRSAPILPASLAVIRPRKIKADMNTVMVDGSIWQVRSFDGDTTGANFKQLPIVAAVTDEAAEIRHQAVLTALTGRCIDYRGRLFLATTPVGGSFLKETIVDKVDEWKRMTPDHPAKAGGEHIGARWISESISMLGNPWQDQAGIERDLKAQDKEAPSFKRDWLGLWVGDFGKFWLYDDDRHTFVHEARRVADMMPLVNKIARGGAFVRESALDLDARWKWGVDEKGQPLPERPQKRITPDIAKRLFQRRDNPAFRSLRATNLNYILGSDINGTGNRFPNTVMIEVTGDAADPNNPEKWHFWVFDVKQTPGDELKHAKELASVYWARMWDSAATESPYRGCGMIVDAQALIHNATASAWGRNPHGLVEEYARLGNFDCRAPVYRPDGASAESPRRRDSHLLVKRLLDEGRLHIHTRCATTLIKSFHTQEKSDKPEQPVKVDTLAGPVDALRYALWACLKGEGLPPGYVPRPDGALSKATVTE